MSTGAAGRVTLLGIPYDASSSYRRGCAAAPRFIREAMASDQSNGWSESLVDTRAPGIIGDAGDVDVGSPDEMRPRVEAAVASVLASGSKPLGLGGDHSVTYPVLRAIRAKHPIDRCISNDRWPSLGKAG